MSCEHSWSTVFKNRTETSGGDADYSWVSIGFDIYEECLKCLATRPITAETALGLPDRDRTMSELLEAILVLGFWKTAYLRLFYRAHMRWIHRRGKHWWRPMSPLDGKRCDWCGAWQGKVTWTEY